jgi:hypothetical protein
LSAKIVGKVDQADGPAGKVLRLNGAGYLEIAPNPALNITEACTLEAWVRPETLPRSGGRIIDKSEAGTSNGYLLDTFPSNSLRFITQAGTLDFPAKLVPGQWSHVAATVSSNGQLMLYLQGQLVAQHASSPLPDIASLLAQAKHLQAFYRNLTEHGLGDSYEAAHARLALDCISATHTRFTLLEGGKLKPLANSVSQSAADESYLATARKLAQGLAKQLASYRGSSEAQKKLMAELWDQAVSEKP